MPDLEQDIATILALIARTEAAAGCRKMIGIVGPPGSGKSTLAAALVDRLNQIQDGQAVLIPMDGFHMDNETLDRVGLRALKGAPQTFDVEDFVATLRALRTAGAEGAIPIFDRDQDRTLPDARKVAAASRILVVEGNYLLLPEAPWSEVGVLLDATVALKPSLSVLEQRLMDRWRSHGLTHDLAYQKTHGNDLKNAQHVLETSTPATLTLHQEGDLSPVLHGMDQAKK